MFSMQAFKDGRKLVGHIFGLGVNQTSNNLCCHTGGSRCNVPSTNVILNGWAVS